MGAQPLADNRCRRAAPGGVPPQSGAAVPAKTFSSHPANTSGPPHHPHHPPGPPADATIRMLSDPSFKCSQPCSNLIDNAM